MILYDTYVYATDNINMGICTTILGEIIGLLCAMICVPLKIVVRGGEFLSLCILK